MDIFLTSKLNRKGANGRSKPELSQTPPSDHIGYTVKLSKYVWKSNWTVWINLRQINTIVKIKSWHFQKYNETEIKNNCNEVIKNVLWIISLILKYEKTLKILQKLWKFILIVSSTKLTLTRQQFLGPIWSKRTSN